MALFLRTHGPDECSGPFCVIHNPSDHPLRDAPMHWRTESKSWSASARTVSGMTTPTM